jgi:hypothetical protein
VFVIPLFPVPFFKKLISFLTPVFLILLVSLFLKEPVPSPREEVGGGLFWTFFGFVPLRGAKRGLANEAVEGEGCEATGSYDKLSWKSSSAMALLSATEKEDT